MSENARSAGERLHAVMIQMVPSIDVWEDCRPNGMCLDLGYVEAMPTYFVDPDSVPQPLNVTSIRVDSVTYARGMDYFLAWQCMLADAPKLILAKWIKAIGESNIRRFAHEMRMRSMMRERSLVGIHGR